MYMAYGDPSNHSNLEAIGHSFIAGGAFAADPTQDTKEQSARRVTWQVLERELIELHEEYLAFKEAIGTHKHQPYATIRTDPLSSFGGLLMHHRTGKHWTEAQLAEAISSPRGPAGSFRGRHCASRTMARYAVGKKSAGDRE